jgi:hypothetical protein
LTPFMSISQASPPPPPHGPIFTQIRPAMLPEPAVLEHVFSWHKMFPPVHLLWQEEHRTWPAAHCTQQTERRGDTLRFPAS